MTATTIVATGTLTHPPLKLECGVENLRRHFNIAGAMLKKIPLYQHIANLAGNKTLVLPVPAFNVINGGSHAGNKLAMQEFMILPVGASSFKEAMKMGVEVYHHLKAVIKKKYGQDATNVGDEGGFAPNIQNEGLSLILLMDSDFNVQYILVVIEMDVAASEFYDIKDKTYDLNFKEENHDGSQRISGYSLKNVYKSFVTDYPIVVSIEDPFDYAKLTSEIGEQVQIVGDDLLVTNPKRVEKAIKEKTCNVLLLKGWSHPETKIRSPSNIAIQRGGVTLKQRSDRQQMDDFRLETETLSQNRFSRTKGSIKNHTTALQVSRAIMQSRKMCEEDSTLAPQIELLHSGLSATPFAVGGRYCYNREKRA
ncbi:enolase-like [Hibiscus syriacus]|uniref:enolase-like n=1 Tax=Hibiscus syriacus TaxID=106335 RepID=UPI00192094FF|nr:enolase-like [Hibiscus syriacus]